MVTAARSHRSTAVSLRRFLGASVLVLALLPATANAAAQSCGTKASAVSVAPDAVAHYKMTMSAALSASVPAQVELANLYRRGHGVTPDLVQAYAWLNVAAAKSTVAADLREEVATCLDLQERLQGQLLSVQLLTRVGAR